MKSRNLYVITGITGKIGGVLARTLLAANQPVRAVVRDADKGAVWTAQGCELALAKMNDEGSSFEEIANHIEFNILTTEERAQLNEN